MSKPENVEEGRGIALAALADWLRRARLRLAGEIEWRRIGKRERACVVMEDDPAPAPEPPPVG